MRNHWMYGVWITIGLCCGASMSGCSGSGGNSDGVVIIPPTPATYQQPSVTICDASVALNEGLLCAISPSRLDAASRDQYGGGNLADSILGFGYHVIAFPPDGSEIAGIYVHLTGSYGRPYNQATAKFGTQTFLEEALEANFITIQLAYNNRFSVNIDECGGDVSRLNIDNCSGDVRREKITGMDLSAVSDTPLADSIEFRIVRLVEYLQAQGFQFATTFTNNGIVDWTKLRVGGHSQGATHALYLGKYFSASAACLFAGGFDVADTVPSIPAENMADWLLDNSVGLDIDKIRAVVAVDDNSYDAFVRTYQHLQMIPDTHYREISGAPYANADGTSVTGHGAVMFDPRYKDLRVDACFSPR